MLQKKISSPGLLLLAASILVIFTNLMLIRANLGLRQQMAQMQQRNFRLQADAIEDSLLIYERKKALLSSRGSPGERVQDSYPVWRTGGESSLDQAPALTLDALRIRAFPELPETDYSLMVIITPSDCPVTFEEAGRWEQLHREAQQSGSARLTVVGMVGHQNREEGMRFARQLGLTFPIVVDTDLIIAPLFGIDRTPFQLLIDRQGKIQAMAGPSLGGNEDFFRTIRKRID